jgi:uncharacterized protein
VKRIVLDTNVLLSAFLWTGPPRAALRQALMLGIEIVRTEETLNEFVRTIDKPKFDKQIEARKTSRPKVIAEFTDVSTIVSPADDVPHDAVVDPKDVMILAAAAGGEVDAIVTGDDDLLRLVSFRGIPIIMPTTFLAQLDSPDPAE